MKPTHWIALLCAVVLIPILYYGGNTVPPAKNKPVPVTNADGTISMPGHEIDPISFDSLYAQSVSRLPAHAVEEIKTVEQKLASLADSSLMKSDFDQLSTLWKEHNELPMAAFYNSLKAKLENSEKSLNFAGQFFLLLLDDHNQTDAVRQWESLQSIDCFERSLKINPDNDTVKIAMATAYIDGLGETMQGVQMLLGITRENPDHIPANLILGKMAIQSGQMDKAVDRFEKILALEPENTEALYFGAEAYKSLGEKEKAIQMLEKCKMIVNKPEFTKDIDNYIKTFK